MNPICTFLLPSRDRPSGLMKAIKSINDTAYDKSKIEILVGLDDDDRKSKVVWEDLMAIDNVAVFVWPRNVIAMFSGLANIATGDWLIMFNDDAEIWGSGWDIQLAAAPLEGVIFQPETYKLNESEYLNATRTGFPFFPNRCWKAFGHDYFLPHPADYAVAELAEKHEWKIDFLKGITVFHDRHK